MNTHEINVPRLIEQVPIDLLTPYARNSRTHSQSQVAQLAASIKEFGWTNPVLIDGDHNIIAGHGRVLAAVALRMDEVPCIRLTDLSDAQRRALVIADNRLAELAGWDEELLAIELQSLRTEHGFDIGLTGFTDADLKALMDDSIDSGNSSSDTTEEFDGDAADKFQLLIEFASEQALAAEYERCQREGLPCKIIQ